MHWGWHFIFDYSIAIRPYSVIALRVFLKTEFDPYVISCPKYINFSLYGIPQKDTQLYKLATV